MNRTHHDANATIREYRRQRIGRRLLAHAQEYATSAGAQQLRLQVLAGNEAARRLYRDTGFAPHAEILTMPLRPGEP